MLACARGCVLTVRERERERERRGGGGGRGGGAADTIVLANKVFGEFPSRCLSLDHTG